MWPRRTARSEDADPHSPREQTGASSHLVAPPSPSEPGHLCDANSASSLSLRVVRRAAEVNSHARLVTHCPRIVSGRDVRGIARADLALSAILHHNLHPARKHVEQMRRLATVGLSDWLHMLRPFPARLERAHKDGCATEVDHIRVALVDELTRLVGGIHLLDVKPSHFRLQLE